MYVPFNAGQEFVSASGLITPLPVPATLTLAPTPTKVLRPRNFTNDALNLYTGTVTNLTQCGTFGTIVIALYIVRTPDDVTVEFARVHLLLGGANVTIVFDQIAFPKRMRATIYSLPGVTGVAVATAAVDGQDEFRESVALKLPSVVTEDSPNLMYSSKGGEVFFTPNLIGYAITSGHSCISATVSGAPYVDEFAIHSQLGGGGFCVVYSV